MTAKAIEMLPFRRHHPDSAACTAGGAVPRLRRVRVVAMIAVLGLTLAACGSAGPNKAGGDAPTASAGAPPATSSSASAARLSRSPAGATIKVMRTAYGRVLVDGKGRALYLFTREHSSSSRCYGACASAWPPLLTAGKPVAGTGARASLLGSTRRRDGSTQVTYRGHSLYRYVGDRQPGQVLCQDVEEFGGRWYVVTPSGSAVL